MSKFKQFLKDFFSGGAITWDKENGWQSHDKNFVANEMYGEKGNTVLGNILNRYTGNGLTDADIEANAFSAEQSALQREWSSQEAERARDWNEQMYAKYNSIGGKIQQAEQAGINPLFAVTENAVSPVSAGASAPGGSSAGSISPTSHGLTDLFGSILGLMKVRAEVQNIEADTKQKEADTEVSLKKLASEIANINSQTDLNIQKVLESATSIEKIKSDMNLNERQAEVFASQINYLDAQANYINAIKEPESRLKAAQALIAEWQEKNKELFKGLEVGADVLGSLINLGLGIFNSKTGRILADKK